MGLDSDLQAYAAMEAKLARAGDDLPKVVADAGLDGVGLVRLRRAWNAAFAADPEVRSSYDAALSREIAAAALAAPAEPSPVAPASIDLGQPSRDGASPWLRQKGDLAQSAAAFAPAAASPAASLVAVATEEVVVVAPVAALPFVEDAPSSSASEASEVEAGARSQCGDASIATHRASSAGLTEEVPIVAPRAALPFGMHQPSAPVADWLSRVLSSSPGEPARPSRPNPLAATEDVDLEVVRRVLQSPGGPLPFAGRVESGPPTPPGAPEASTAAPPSERPTSAPASSSALAETGEVDLDALRRGAERARPFGGAAAPSSGRRDGAPHDLTLEQHASLAVELAVFPERSAETLRRYGLDAARHVEVDAYWRGRVASDEGARVCWERACASYKAWLLTNAAGR